MATSKDIKGMMLDVSSFRITNVHIMFTSDHIGETLTIGTDLHAFTVAFEDVMEIVRQERVKNGKA